MLGGYLPAGIVVILMAMVLTEVLTRYLIRAPLIIADEMGAYMLVFITFMGLAYTWQKKGHVRIEFIISRLSFRARKWLRVITLGIAFGFCPLLVKASYDLIEYSSTFHQRSGTWLMTPLIYPQIPLLVGSVLLTLQVLVHFIRTIRDFRILREENL
jgi:TRAP-type C4-dicarboxylate transport system permease small subunit